MKFGAAARSDAPLPGSTGYIQHPASTSLSEQRHHPAPVLLGPTLRVPDVHLPHFGSFSIGILVRKTLGCHAERAGSEHAVDRHAAAPRTWVRLGWFLTLTVSLMRRHCESVSRCKHGKVGVKERKQQFRQQVQCAGFLPNTDDIYMSSEKKTNFNPMTLGRVLTPTLR